MVNQIIRNLSSIVFLLTTICSVYGQSDYPEEFVKLIDFEYDEIKDDSIRNVSDGRYYKTNYEDGKLISIETIGYKDRKKHGESLTFRQGLGIMFISKVVNFEKGVLHGYFSSTDRHTFSKQGYYKKGKKEGVWKESNGTNFSEITYKKDAKCGFFKSNDSTLKTKISGHYKKDKKDGIWIIEDTETNEKTKEVYKDGKLISSN